MKNVFKQIAFIAVVAVIALSFALSLTACNKSGGSFGVSLLSGAGGGSGGRLTINGRPGGGNKVYVFPTGTEISALVLVTSPLAYMGSMEALNTSPSGNVFSLLAYPSAQPWTGSGSKQVFLMNDTTNPVGWLATVNFSDGSATVPFSSFKAVTD